MADSKENFTLHLLLVQWQCKQLEVAKREHTMLQALISGSFYFRRWIFPCGGYVYVSVCVYGDQIYWITLGWVTVSSLRWYWKLNLGPVKQSLQPLQTCFYSFSLMCMYVCQCVWMPHVYRANIVQKKSLDNLELVLLILCSTSW